MVPGFKLARSSLVSSTSDHTGSGYRIPQIDRTAKC